MEIVDRLERHWYGSKIDRNFRSPRAATDEQIAAFEDKNGVKLPADFREYLLRLNGIDEDPDFFCFWPIDKLDRVNPEHVKVLQYEWFFNFADWGIESHYYAIYLGNDPLFQNRVILPDFPGSPGIASNFTEFLELYLRDDPKLFGP
jgi:hypothetical protein